MTRRLAVAVLRSTALVTVLLAGCVSPAPSTGVYEAKASLTASDALSSARTALVAVRTQQRGRLDDRALEVLLQESEHGLDSVTATFDSVQPPRTAQADALRDELNRLLTAASDDARELRIAVRRDDAEALREHSESLTTTADELERFAEAHRS